MKELEKLRYFESVLAGTHMLLESMEAKDLHLAFKVVSELQSKIVYLLTRIVHQEQHKSNSPSGSNHFMPGRSAHPVQRGGVPVISSVNTSRLSLDSRKTSPGGRLDDNALAKKRTTIANGVGIFWAMNTFLLPTADINVAPESDLSNELTRQGFGLSMSSTTDRRQMVNTTCTADELMVQICRRYPRVPALSRIGFTYHYRPSGNQRHLIPITSKMPYDLFSLLGNEGILYLRPKALLKSIPSRQGPQEPICIDDDDEDAAQPTPISTGRRQQPNASPGMSGMRGNSGPMMSSNPSGVPGPILQQQRGGPNSSMPPPQMVPGLRNSAPNPSIPLPGMGGQQRNVPASANIQLPMPPSQPQSSVPMFSSPASTMAHGPPPGQSGQPGLVYTTQNAIPSAGPPGRMNTMPHTQRGPPIPQPQPEIQPKSQPSHQPLPQPLPQHPHPHPQIEVLKIPVEGGTTTPKPMLPNDEPPNNSIGEPPEKRQAMGPSSIATTINVRRVSNQGLAPQSANSSPAPGPPGHEPDNNTTPPPPPPSASNVGGPNPNELIEKIQQCMEGGNDEFLFGLIRKALLSQGHFFSARSFIRALVPGAKRHILTDPRLNPVIVDIMRKMARDELGTVHLEVGAKNARDTGFIKAWPISGERLQRLRIPEISYAQTLLMTTAMVPGTVERDLTTLSAAADWSTRKQNIIEFLRQRGVSPSSNGGPVDGSTSVNESPLGISDGSNTNLNK